MSTQQTTPFAKRRGLTQDDGGKREVASLITMGLRRVVGVGQVTLHSLVDYAVCIAIHRGSQILIVCVCFFS